MRLVSALLVVATTLLVICDATSVNMKKASVVGQDVDSLKDISKTRFLRARSVDSEERAFNLKNIFGNRDFANSKLKKMMKDEKIKLAMYKTWDKKYTVVQIKSNMNVDRSHPRNAKLFYDYLTKKTAPVKGLKPKGNAKVHFDVKPPQVKTIDEIDKAMLAAANRAAQ